MAKRNLEFQLKIDPKTGIASISKTKKAVKSLGKSASKDANKISKSFNKTSKSVKNFGAVSKTAFAVAAAGIVAYAFAIKKAINAASDLQEVQGKFDVVFRNTINQAEEMAKVLVDSYAMSEREAKQYLSSVQDLLVPMGMAVDKAILMSDSVVKLSADLASFNNLPTAKVMEDIQSALVGNFETMKKYGVILNETVLKQKALEMSLWDGKGVIDANTKAQVAYKLMIEGSAAAIGDQRRTMGSYANQMKQLKANYEDLAAAIGKELLPVVTEWLTKMNEAIKNNPELIKQIGQFAEVTLEAATAVGKLVAAAISFIVGPTDLLAGLKERAKELEATINLYGGLFGKWEIPDFLLFEFEKRKLKEAKHELAIVLEMIENIEKASGKTWADVKAEMQALIDSKKGEEKDDLSTSAMEAYLTELNRLDREAQIEKIKLLYSGFEKEKMLLKKQRAFAIADAETAITDIENRNDIIEFIQTLHHIKISQINKEEAKQRLRLEKDFNTEYNALGKTQLQLDIEAIKAQAEIWREAGLNRIEIKKWEIDKIIELKKAAAKELEYIDKHLNDKLLDGVENWAMNFSSTLNDMLWGAKTTFADIARSFGKMVTQMLIQEATLKLIGSATKGTGLLGFLSKSEKGNVINNGAMMAYAKGGIVNQPTVFPMANGAGLMGEAGAEAILPLTRMSGGDLGVKSEDNNGGGQTINIMINAVDSQSFAEAVERNPNAVVGVVSNALEENTGLRQSIRNTI